MGYRKIVLLTIGILAFGPACLIAQPAMVLANSQSHPSQQRYSATEVQNALEENIENYYYMFKDHPVEKPEHIVSQVRVLHYVQHDRTVILVGSCLIDRDPHIITGVLGRSRGALVFTGGWQQTSAIHTPLYWRMGANQREAYVMGVAIDRSITQLRLNPLPSGRPLTASVSSEGYFAAAVPVAKTYSRGPWIFVEGLTRDGKVVYSAPKPPGLIGPLVSRPHTRNSDN